ncbi:NUDIX domain-containing protein [Pasteurellaceae bacterium HPA106]|uniref:NUDIX hydrolase n=1 Tax=Spirabiliibacterium pneumoniae TaxID=221400 RepID=UPI001AACA236|nr:NUDIX domain-containing protein [Spirabiliibacterium pneumoniae]MBE2895516.1 NUDIX domain-containing protein [Spirabiliibacterium pneumoniae]
MTGNIDKLALIVLNNRKLLVTRSHNKTAYYLPGGKREAGERDAQALVREVKEELNVTLDEASLRFVDRFSAQADGKPEGVMVVMSCYQGEYTGELQASNEIAELVWITSVDLAKCSKAATLVVEYLHQKQLID